MSYNSQISFQDNGAPYSLQFDDIYFDTESGCQQSEQVFIEGNQINARIYNSKQPLIIGETGFGTGLNFFLTAYKLLQAITNKDEADVTNIHFISVEKYPLSKAQIAQSLKMWPDLQPIINQTLAHYPDTPKEKCEISLLNGKLKLTILFDDATSALSTLNLAKNGKINAWYLDGFSPAQNMEMWSEGLFEQIARLSADDATLATFTVAGFVRRHLTNVGFRVMKKLTPGKKKQTLVAKFQQASSSGKGYMLRPSVNKAQHVTIIGGGIASACLTYLLVKQGVKVTLICKDEEIAQGASSNAIGALYPLIHLKQDEISEFYVSALLRAREVYDELLAAGYTFAHQWCGLLELSFKEPLQKRQHKFEQKPVWPENIILGVSAAKASALAGVTLNNGGMFMPQAGWIAPSELVKVLFKAASDIGQVKIKHNIDVSEISQKADNRWQLTTNKGLLEASVLIVCGGAESNLLRPINQLPLTPVRGQVSEVSTEHYSQQLQTVICHKGYMTPVHQGKFCIGATFNKNDRDTHSRADDDQFNINMVSEALPELPRIELSHIIGSKARLRATTPDHLPIAGPVPIIKEHTEIYGKLAEDKNWKIHTPAPYYKSLYVMSGLGARGLCSAPLIADILVADLCNLPYPVDNKMRFNLSANRFIVKDIIKRKLKPE
ncbi:bifunctional tRNA (5-methylaminomethyl-2-thiouridine)(34)-methyltransferase MnmD/FAD-dependent 5-carboxymethylaminomethyl-2-thiouridine(34) oxidoreductase MnmC [Thalassotalea algicola]|uniref:bifunctional tRNA (5-methylaminomethyl-2-thiouridine)(34)-methyltransferase MnmD/FAD-dependent 5-carboxymethylaminomethyl-2-thiouridine(34) oxidoreductase MnmC n=1 Tax=Thalassotalea algicola TaxID=2716224 RepID=UPI002E2DFE8C|nr:bifunctional tRNA (5-methylaminomethyl-2-thiouridine)(34)-methyltransferase MnmD/FAD-dependent 5-carboxymethylaminomethyl-2-thiouridine(34) oxidoreductase MnmC [Thalassotalea algicola]